MRVDQKRTAQGIRTVDSAPEEIIVRDDDSGIEWRSVSVDGDTLLRDGDPQKEIALVFCTRT
jgi:hypothetical protein